MRCCLFVVICTSKWQHFFVRPRIYRFELPASTRDTEVFRINLGVLRALMALRDCGALIHLMVFLCCRVHRSLDSRSNFQSLNPAIVSRRSSISCRLSTTGILLFLIFTNIRKLQSIGDVRFYLYLLNKNKTR